MTGALQTDQAPQAVTRERPFRVTVAILNYDGRELLDVVVPSVLAQQFGPCRIIVVDNGSRDGSAAYVTSRWPSVEVLLIAENIGVAAALNRAVEASDSELVALLNNDIELEPTWLGELVVALDAHPETASACGKLLRFHDRTTIDSAGDLLFWSSAVHNRGAGELDEGQFDNPQPVFAACAGAALFRRRAFDVIGPFDESFFAYLEDVDWECVPNSVDSARGTYQLQWATTWVERRRASGPGSTCVISGETSSSSLSRRSRRRPCCVTAGSIAANQLLMLVASARDRVLAAHIRGLLDVVSCLPQALGARKRIQGSRVVGVRELDAVMAATLRPSSSPFHRLLFELAPLTVSRHRAAPSANRNR